MSGIRASKFAKAPKPASKPSGPIGVNLLPDEIKQAENAASQRRVLVLLTIMVIVAVGAASAGAWLNAQSAAAQLAQAQAKAASIISEQAQHLEGQAVSDKIVSTQDAQILLTTAEIDWQKLLVSIIGVTPATISIQSFELNASTPFAVIDDVPGPLDAPRLGAVTMTATTVNVPDIDVWVKSLEKLDGFAGTRVLRLENGTVTVDFYVSKDRVTARFDPAVEGYDEPTPTPTPEPTQTAEPTPTPTPTKEG